MAIELNYTDKFGNVLNNSYWRVEGVALNNKQKIFNVSVFGYKNEIAKNNRNPFERLELSFGSGVFTQQYPILINKTKNAIEIAYELTKTYKYIPPGTDDPEVINTFFNGGVDV